VSYFRNYQSIILKESVNEYEKKRRTKYNIKTIDFVLENIK
jgi:hypothetical protein